MTIGVFIKTSVGAVQSINVLVNIYNLYQNYIVAKMAMDISVKESTTATVTFAGLRKIATVLSFMQQNSVLHTLQIVNIINSVIRLIWLVDNKSNTVDALLTSLPQMGYMSIYIILIVYWDNTIRVIKRRRQLNKDILTYLFMTVGFLFIFTITLSVLGFSLTVNYINITYMVVLMMCGIYNSIILLYHYDKFKAIVKQSQTHNTIDDIMLDTHCPRLDQGNHEGNHEDNHEDVIDTDETHVSSIVSSTIFNKLRWFWQSVPQMIVDFPAPPDSRSSRQSSPSWSSTNSSKSTDDTYETIVRTIKNLIFVTLSSTLIVIFSIIIIMLKIALNVSPGQPQYNLYLIGIHVIQECTVASIITFVTFVPINHVSL